MSVREFTIEIGGMSCGHCSMTVEKSLKEIDGVESVEVSLNPGYAKIGVADAAALEDIRKEAVAVVERKGFSAA